MAQLMFAPVFQAVDANGAPYSGALLYTYTAGTTTPLTAYQDNTLVTPHANPVVADASGRFAPIYFSNVSVKVVLKTAAGVTITTIDPVIYSIGLGITDGATAIMVTIADDILTLGRANNPFNVRHIDDDQYISIAGGSGGSGGKAFFYGQSHSTGANDYTLGDGSNIRYQWDFSALQHIFSGAVATSSTFRSGQNTTDTPGVGNATTGLGLSSTGAFSFSTSGTHTCNKTADGTNLNFASAGTTQGAVSIAGAVVTYAAFFGSHWSQPKIISDIPECLRGKIVESCDEMCEWPEGQDDRLPKFLISRTPGSKKVYGVFAWWDEDRDAFIGSLGAYFICMAPGQTVEIGDYIESNGDGNGRVQASGNLKSSTVAKVTSTTVVETYPDGSYLVPCTLHCG